MKLSDRVFMVMEARGVSQKELSRLTGIGQSTISDWKRKHTDPTARYIPKIARALEISIDDLFKGVQ